MPGAVLQLSLQTPFPKFLLLSGNICPQATGFPVALPNTGFGEV